jgi:pimeloyl-ACP methyl ester carboxylesterase
VRAHAALVALAIAPVRSARAAWVVERHGAAFVVSADSMGHVPAFTVTGEAGTVPMGTRDGFLRFPKPCGRVQLRVSAAASAGAAIVVDEATVHRVSFGGATLAPSGHGSVERFSWRGLPHSEEPRVLELDLEPPSGTCAVRVRAPGATLFLDRTQLDAVAAGDVVPLGFQLDPLSLVPNLVPPSEETFVARASERSDRFVLRWANGPEFVFESSADARMLLALARDVKLDGLPEASRALVTGTLALLRERLAELLGAPAADPALVRVFTEDLRRILTPLRQGRDPLESLEGAARLGLLSPVDGRAQEVAAYFPPLPRATTRRYPLVVALHGLDGRPMNFLRAVLGEHATGLTGALGERLPQRREPLDAFVIAPQAHGNAMYRGMGERAVLDAIDATITRFPIDRDRVTITGASMGGTGSAAIALRHPERFAAAMPLCGYQSYFVRRDLTGATLHPWESIAAQRRSPALQAANGVGLPLRVVHGTQDFPIENSKVLVDAYKQLGQSVVYDTPSAGHDVWTWTFTQGRGLQWLLAQRRGPRPHAHHEGNDVSAARAHALRVEAAIEPGTWFEVDARENKARLRVSTKGVARLRVDAALLDARTKELVVDGTRVVLERKRTAFALERRGGKWARAKGPAPTTARLFLRDVFEEPVQVLYGEGPTARLVAETFVPHRPFQDLALRIRPLEGTPTPPARPTLVVGTVQDAHIDALLRAEGVVFGSGTLTVGSRALEGDALGIALAVPGKHLTIVAAHDDRALVRALSLPDLLPTLVVFDGGVASDAHPVVAGRRRYVLAGQAATLLQAPRGR